MQERKIKDELFEPAKSKKNTGPVDCFGKTFENEEARRRYFSERLAEKLKDPEFRKIEGFPIGTNEDILGLSDPPYYTACPNPFISEFVKQYGNPYNPRTDKYSREPFAADVSEGKNDPIYNAHSYHTKVPHKAIMRYILHYTEPGDIVFDGFCGTGMTGVAAQACGDKDVVESLGYKVDKGKIFRQEPDEHGKLIWKPFSKIGARRAIQNDLSPAATFIAYNYNTPVDVEQFTKEAKLVLQEVEEECAWMYETMHTDGRTKGQINYTVWSDVFVCPECSNEIVFWDVAVDKDNGAVRKEFPCPHCHANLNKKIMERAWTNKFDKAINQTVKQAKQIPVLINYSIGKQRYEKQPDEADFRLIERIEKTDIPYWIPTDRMPDGDEARRNDDIGITHTHHFYTKRNLLVLASFVDKCRKRSIRMSWIVTAVTEGSSRLNRERPFGLPSKLSGTLYVSSMIREINVIAFLKRKITKYEAKGTGENEISSCQSTTDLSMNREEMDYIFTDPPFGGNLMYSELNFLWESWLKVFTNNKEEAIQNDTQHKGLLEYQQLMVKCFHEYYRILKPGRWMTVEFHNSKNSVWNAIQEALQHAGFVVADVRTLDKQQGTFKQTTSLGAVKQDLIISAYKPNGGLEDRFKLEAGTEEGVWDFVRSHLKQLPVFVGTSGHTEIIAERQNYLLFDRMVAFHVQRGISIPLSAFEFYQGLIQRFPERDGMFFLSDQVAEYDKKRMSAKEIQQLSLFVVDEASAIQWLKQQLSEKPQTFQEIQPQFMKEIPGWMKHERPLELYDLLLENFLRYDGEGDVPSQIHSYISTNFKDMRNLSKNDPILRQKAKDRWYVPDPNKAGDLEKLRERALLREFWEYLPDGYKPAKKEDLERTVIPGLAPKSGVVWKGKKIKIIRTEAVRAGFKYCWQNRDYRTIIAVAQCIPEDVLQEDPKLLMWYDQALTRIGDET
jgi:DNA modification methylase